jgi:hypothetical protein
MGILDHLRTWQFETSMPPGECVRTFAATLGGPTGSPLGSRWRVATGGDDSSRRAVATYGGRAAAVGGPAALGSQLTFTATAGHDGTTTCTMAMTRTAKVHLLFTADARFFRSAMDRVARRLRDDGAGLDLIKR